jgi:integrase
VNPAADIPAPKGADGRVGRSLTVEEARALLDTALPDPEDLVFAFALLTGLRPEEYLGVRRQDVDLVAGRGLVRVRQVAVKLRGGGWTFLPPKTRKGVRDVPFPAWLYHEMKRLEPLVDSRRRATGEGWVDHSLVFPSRTGEPQSSRVLGMGRFRRLLKRAGLPSHFTLYSLRYTFATLQYMAGERDRVISDLMGHTRTHFTKDVYTKVQPVMREQASDSLERLLLGADRATFAQSVTEQVM